MQLVSEYSNRYKDKIVFSLDEDKVYMRGQPMDYMRYGLSNDYTEAYLKYLLDNKDRQDDVMSEKSFEIKMEEDVEFFKKYSKFTKSSEEIYMVDPSGGPYIQLGSNLAYYFKVKGNIIVKKIDIDEEEVSFEVDVNLLDE
jgi:hypothetical protein